MQIKKKLIIRVVRSHFQIAYENLNSVRILTGNFDATVLISVELYAFTRIANLIHPLILSAFFSL